MSDLPSKVPPKKASHWQIPVVGLVLLAAGLSGVWLHFRASDAVQYQTRKATIGSVTRVVTASGTVNPVITVQVGTYVSGVVLARYCDYNTQVKKGQICAKIDPGLYQPIVEQDRANLAIAKAQLKKDTASLAYARANLDRNQQLVIKQAVSQDALDNSRSAFDQAAAVVELDEANIAFREAVLKAAEVNLEYTDIRSPVDGTVVSRNVEMGQTVAASFQTPTLFLIATDLTHMQIDVNVSESDVGSLSQGGKASFRVEAFANKRFDAVIREIRQAPLTIQNVVTYDAVLNTSNEELLLKPGMTATVRLVASQRDTVLRVPDQALRFTPKLGTALLNNEGAPGVARVFVLRDGAPAEVRVDTGLDDDTYTEIVGGDLKDGDEVIIGEAAVGSAAQQPARTSGPRAPRL